MLFFIFTQYLFISHDISPVYGVRTHILTHPPTERERRKQGRRSVQKLQKKASDAICCTYIYILFTSRFPINLIDCRLYVVNIIFHLYINTFVYYIIYKCHLKWIKYMYIVRAIGLSLCLRIVSLFLFYFVFYFWSKFSCIKICVLYFVYALNSINEVPGERVFSPKKKNKKNLSLGHLKSFWILLKKIYL